MGMNRWTACDICFDPRPDHHIVFDRRPNDNEASMDFCNHCLDFLSDYIDRARESLDTIRTRYS